MVAGYGCLSYLDCPSTSGHCRCYEVNNSTAGTTYSDICPYDDRYTTIILYSDPEPVKKAAPIIFNAIHGRIFKRLWIHVFFNSAPGKIRAPPDEVKKWKQ